MLDIILSRRSIRRYLDRPVTEKELENLLRAAMAAPSACNQQPWHFVLITERRLLEAIPVIHPHAGMAAGAQAAILACGDPSLEKSPGYWEQDLAAAVENLLLAAHAQGLGAVWCGVHPRQERVQAFRKLLGIPDRIVPFALIPVGHPAESKGREDRFRKSRVHRNGWQGHAAVHFLQSTERALIRGRRRFGSVIKKILAPA